MKTQPPLTAMNAKKAAPLFHDVEVADVMSDLNEWNMPGVKLLTPADLAGAVSKLLKVR